MTKLNNPSIARKTGEGWHKPHGVFSLRAMNALRRAWPPFRRRLGKAGAILWRALKKYNETDGEQRAASFAYYAFFALFPLMVLVITIGTRFLGSEAYAATKITEQVQHYMPVDSELTSAVIRTINGVLRSRTSAGAIAFVVLAWSALRFFQGLVHGVNRAWGTKDYPWWRMPLKNLLMVIILTSALLIGIILPAVIDQMQYQYWKHSWEVGLDFRFMISFFKTLRLLVSPLVLFYGFILFYKYAPRRRTTLREVWIGALLATIGLDLLQRAFLLYTKSITNFNALYGTFGSVIALLMWIYLSGSIIILGGCLCAARYEINMALTDQAESNRDE